MLVVIVFFVSFVYYGCIKISLLTWAADDLCFVPVGLLFDVFTLFVALVDSLNLCCLCNLLLLGCCFLI